MSIVRPTPHMCDSVWYVAPTQAMVVTELCSGGDLAKAMRRARRTRAFGWYMRGAKIALDVACGLAYLHNSGVSSLHFSWGAPDCIVCACGLA
jgi:hypothetical protein